MLSVDERKVYFLFDFGHIILFCLPYINWCIGPIVKENIFLIVHGTQVIGNVIGQCFQIECMLGDDYRWTFQLLIRHLGYHLHV